jgi:hypothetical protein
MKKPGVLRARLRKQRPPIVRGVGTPAAAAATIFPRLAHLVNVELRPRRRQGATKRPHPVMFLKESTKRTEKVHFRRWFPETVVHGVA